MAKTTIKAGFRYGFTPGYVVVNDVFNESTGNKDIQEYYNGSLNWGHAESFSGDINHAVIYPTEKEARNHAMLCTYNVPGYPGVFCHVERAHIESVI
jgi:hypothetical protein